MLKLFSSNLLYKLLIKDEFDIAISYLEGPTTRIISGCPFTRTKLINWVHTEINDKKMLLQSYRSYSELIRSYKKFNRTVFSDWKVYQLLYNSNIQNNIFIQYMVWHMYLCVIIYISTKWLKKILSTFLIPSSINFQTIPKDYNYSFNARLTDIVIKKKLKTMNSTGNDCSNWQLNPEFNQKKSLPLHSRNLWKQKTLRQTLLAKRLLCFAMIKSPIKGTYYFQSMRNTRFFFTCYQIHPWHSSQPMLTHWVMPFPPCSISLRWWFRYHFYQV